MLLYIPSAATMYSMSFLRGPTFIQCALSNSPSAGYFLFLTQCIANYCYYELLFSNALQHQQCELPRGGENTVDMIATAIM